MEGQGKNIPTISGSSAMMDMSGEDLADNRSGSVDMGSTRSIPVVREQYCMCTPKTRLEKRLFITLVTLLVVIISLLVIIIILATRDMDDKEVKKLVKALTSKF